ncbi:hypothetical protein BKA69DRAFT_1081519 [Paraphysoderma sedebokerense]|nr:hypothetical protein BKA69DRAFT_1081519 [Paraphysoderma sedebokerense]
MSGYKEYETADFDISDAIDLHGENGPVLTDYAPPSSGFSYNDVSAIPSYQRHRMTEISAMHSINKEETSAPRYRPLTEDFEGEQTGFLVDSAEELSGESKYDDIPLQPNKQRTGKISVHHTLLNNEQKMREEDEALAKLKGLASLMETEQTLYHPERGSAATLSGECGALAEAAFGNYAAAIAEEREKTVQEIQHEVAIDYNIGDPRSLYHFLQRDAKQKMADENDKYGRIIPNGVAAHTQKAAMKCGQAILNEELYSEVLEE